MIMIDSWIEDIRRVIEAEFGYTVREMNWGWDIQCDGLYVQFQLFRDEHFYCLSLREMDPSKLIVEARAQLIKIFGSSHQWDGEVAHPSNF